MARIIYFRRPHTSWVIVFISISFLVGAFCAHLFSDYYFGLNVWLYMSLVLIAGSIVIKNVPVTVILAVMGGIFLGLWRCSPAVYEIKEISSIIGSNVTVSGTVANDVEEIAPNQYRLRIEGFAIDNKTYQGNLWVELAAETSVERGDYLTLSGKLTNGFGSYSGSLKQANISEIVKNSQNDFGLQLRNNFSSKLREYIDDPEASLGLGFLVGQKSSLPSSLTDVLRVAGLTHIVVASGYNLTILVRLTRRLFMKISKFMATSIAMIMIGGFITITGWSPSMSRAGLVSFLGLLAWYYGRKIHPVVLISFAAAVTVFTKPSYIWNDLGWQLSFASFAGVMILAPLLQRYFYGVAKPGVIRQIIGETLSAYIMTLPLILGAFGVLSSVALFTNLMILPLIPLAMGLTFMTGVVGVISSGFAHFIGLVTSWLLQYMIKVAEYFASLSWSQIIYSFNSLDVILWYLMIGALCIYLRKNTGYKLSSSNVVE